MSMSSSSPSNPIRIIAFLCQSHSRDKRGRAFFTFVACVTDEGSTKPLFLTIDEPEKAKRNTVSVSGTVVRIKDVEKTRQESVFIQGVHIPNIIVKRSNLQFFTE